MLLHLFGVAEHGAFPLDVSGCVPVIAGRFSVNSVGEFCALCPRPRLFEVVVQDLDAVVVILLSHDVVFGGADHVDLGFPGLGVLDGHLGVVLDDGRERGTIALCADVRVWCARGFDDLWATHGETTTWVFFTKGG